MQQDELEAVQGSKHRAKDRSPELRAFMRAQALLDAGREERATVMAMYAAAKENPALSAEGAARLVVTGKAY